MEIRFLHTFGEFVFRKISVSWSYGLVVTDRMVFCFLVTRVIIYIFLKFVELFLFGFILAQ